MNTTLTVATAANRYGRLADTPHVICRHGRALVGGYYDDIPEHEGGRGMLRCDDTDATTRATARAKAILADEAARRATPYDETTPAENCNDAGCGPEAWTVYCRRHETEMANYRASLAEMN